MTYEEAKAAGIKRYMGRPCKRGHTGERYTASCSYVTCHGGYRAVRLDLMREMKNQPCMDCKQSFHPCVMDFDHRDASEKLFTIAMFGKFVSVEKLKTEAAKCDVICANCHRMRTLNRRGR